MSFTQLYNLVVLSDNPDDVAFLEHGLRNRILDGPAASLDADNKTFGIVADA